METTVITRPGFVQDPTSMVRSSGRQVDWDNVPDTFKSNNGKKHIPAGTDMSEQADGTIIPRIGQDVVADATLKTTQLLISAAEEGARFVSETGYGTYTSGRVYEQLLPGYGTTGWATRKAELEVAGFQFEKYADSRAS